MPANTIHYLTLRAKVLRYQEMASYYAQCSQPNGHMCDPLAARALRIMDQRLSASYYAAADKYRDAMLDAER